MPAVYLGVKCTPKIDFWIKKIHESLESDLSSSKISSLIYDILNKGWDISKKEQSHETKIDDLTNEVVRVSRRFNQMMNDEHSMINSNLSDDREDNEYNRRMYFFHLFMPLNNAVIDEYF